MKNKSRYACPLRGQGLLSALNVSLLMCVFLFLLTACSEKEQKPKDFIEIDMVPAIEGEAKKMPLQEWAKSVRFIPLETNDNLLMEYVYNVFQRGDKLLVQDRTRVLVFDMNGKYLYDIGSLGEGPTEFVSMGNITLHNDLIYISEFRNRIKAYDWEGNFVKKLVLPAKAYGLITLPGKEEMLAYVANPSGEETIRFYHLRGEQVLDSIPNPFIYPKKQGSIVMSFSPDFMLSQGSLTAFIELNSDTVYRVDENLKPQPYIVFGMDEYLFTREQRYNRTLAQMQRNPNVLDGKYPLMVSGEIGDKIFIRNGFGSSKHTSVFDKEHTFCYDKQTKEVNKYFLTYPENDLGILEGAAFVPRFVLGDKYLVDWEQPDNDENPVLVLVEP